MRTLQTLAYTLLATITALEAQASGFALRQQSTSAMGTAFAGAASTPQDASVLFYNPAAIVVFDKPTTTISNVLIAPDVRFTNKNSRDGGGGAISGGNGGQAGQTVVLPAFYQTYPIDEKWFAGLSFNVPFANTSKYDRTWVGRYQSVTSEVRTYTIVPSIAYKLDDKMSVAIGPSIQRASAVLANAIDFGLITGGAGAAESNDGFVDIRGEDWSMGYLFGAYYQASEDTRFGLSFRSTVGHTLEGHADFTSPVGALAGAFVDTDAKARLTTPAVFLFSVSHDVSDDLTLMADVEWTKWSTFRELRVDYANPAQADTVSNENWRDTWFGSVGAIYRPADWYDLRVGAAFDQSPVLEAYRTARVPDNNRVWLTVGTRMNPVENMTLDLTYGYIFVGDTDINLTRALSGTINGSYDSTVQVLGLQATFNF